MLIRQLKKSILFLQGFDLVFCLLFDFNFFFKLENRQSKLFSYFLTLLSLVFPIFEASGKECNLLFHPDNLSFFTLN